MPYLSSCQRRSAVERATTHPFAAVHTIFNQVDGPLTTLSPRDVCSFAATSRLTCQIVREAGETGLWESVVAKFLWGDDASAQQRHWLQERTPSTYQTPGVAAPQAFKLAPHTGIRANVATTYRRQLQARASLARHRAAGVMRLATPFYCPDPNLETISYMHQNHWVQNSLWCEARLPCDDENYIDWLMRAKATRFTDFVTPHGSRFECPHVFAEGAPGIKIYKADGKLCKTYPAFVNIKCISSAPNGEALLLRRNMATCVLMLQTGQTWDVPQPWTQASWSPDSHYLALQHAAAVTLYDTATGVPSHSWPATFCNNVTPSLATSSAWLPHSRSLLLCAREELNAFDLAAPQPLRHYDLEQPESYLNPLPWSRCVAEAGFESCNAFAISPNGHAFAALKYRAGVTRAALCMATTDPLSVDATSPYHLRVLLPHSRPASMAWSPNSHYLAVAWAHQLLLVHHPTQRYHYLPQTYLDFTHMHMWTRKCIHLQLAFSPSSQHLALSTSYGLNIYNVRAEILLERRATNERQFPCACDRHVLQWSADETRLLWGQNQTMVLLADEPLQLTAKQKLVSYYRPMLAWPDRLTKAILAKRYQQNGGATQPSEHTVFCVSLSVYLGCAVFFQGVIPVVLKKLLPKIDPYLATLTILVCNFSAASFYTKMCGKLFYFEKTPRIPHRRRRTFC